MPESLYLKRYASQNKLIEQSPPEDLSLCVVIPCYNESQLLQSLESLNVCNPISSSVEIIVIINDSDQEENEVLKQNNIAYQEALDWSKVNSSENRNYFIRHISGIKFKSAGVGYARKIGMDEAVRRFNEAGTDGMILCFDADSICSKNYLEVMEKIAEDGLVKGCSINYEHPLKGYDESIISGIINYELHLRYYINALRFCGYPYAHHTIGSSMAVRSSIYEKSGGMNKRKAGEDFYFLYKIIPYGNYMDVTECTIYPSPRVSDRVPFGTGRFMSGWVSGDVEKKSSSYSPNTFMELKTFIESVPQYYKQENVAILINDLPEAVRLYMQQNNLEGQISRLKKATGNQTAFVKHFFHWFNGLNVLKYVHFSRDFHHSNIPIEECSAWLFENYYRIKAVPEAPIELLHKMRLLDNRFMKNPWKTNLF